VTGDFGDRRAAGTMSAHLVLRPVLPPIHAVI
jgi:hypothetical protein